MCGRYTLKTNGSRVASLFELFNEPELEARYNIAPTQQIPVVLEESYADGRTLEMMHWDLIPSWADDPTIGARMINARAETVAEKPSYRSAFKRRRCLVVADGFYEFM
jgi:putative SOS response-associated peptidase YedK